MLPFILCAGVWVRNIHRLRYNFHFIKEKYPELMRYTIEVHIVSQNKCWVFIERVNAKYNHKLECTSTLLKIHGTIAIRDMVFGLVTRYPQHLIEWEFDQLTYIWGIFSKPSRILNGFTFSLIWKGAYNTRCLSNPYHWHFINIKTILEFDKVGIFIDLLIMRNSLLFNFLLSKMVARKQK